MTYEYAIIIICNLPLDDRFAIYEYQEAKQMAAEAMAFRSPAAPRASTILEGTQAAEMAERNPLKYRIFRCPRCNSAVSEQTENTKQYPDRIIRYPFCRKCGQAILWKKGAVCHEQPQCNV